MKKLITTCALLTSVSMISFAQSKQAGTTMSMQAEPGKAAVAKQKAVAAPAPVARPAAHKGDASDLKADKTAKAYQKEYNLTNEQTQRVYESERNFNMQEEDMKRNNVPTNAGPYVQMNMQRDQTMKSVLSDVQFAKYEAKKRQQAPAHKD